MKTKECTEGDATEVLHTAHGRGDCLGYIHYSAVGGSGTVEITNKDARLELEHLNFGATGKRHKNHLAGEHGDGLKVALAVFMRQPQSHIVRFYASGYVWNWKWRERSHNLGVDLTKVTDNPQKTFYKTSEERAQGLIPLPFVAKPSRDVQILIGIKDKRKVERLDERGVAQESLHLSIEDFRKCQTVASWFTPVPDAQRFRTNAGTLFSDDAHRGKTYLKGLLIPKSWINRALDHGFDFQNGNLNRDRDALLKRDDEIRARIAIWNGVIRLATGDTLTELVGKLHELLLTEKYGDVVGAQKYLLDDVVTVLWSYLRGLGKWYYNRDQKDKVCGSFPTKVDSLPAHLYN